LSPFFGFSLMKQKTITFIFLMYIFKEIIMTEDHSFDVSDLEGRRRNQLLVIFLIFKRGTISKLCAVYGNTHLVLHFGLFHIQFRLYENHVICQSYHPALQF
jgi:hypothetical protein